MLARFCPTVDSDDCSKQLEGRLGILNAFLTLRYFSTCDEFIGAHPNKWSKSLD